MTVIRGDAARSLMARTRSARRQPASSRDISSWSQSRDMVEPDQARASARRAAGPPGKRLLGTSPAQRHGGVVPVMTELVEQAVAAAGSATRRESWTRSGGVVVQVSEQPAACAAAAGDALAPHHDAFVATTAVDPPGDSWGLRPQQAQASSGATMTTQPTC